MALKEPITAETELQKQPTKDQMIQKPNRDEFEKEMKELEAIAQTTLTEVR